MKFFTIIIIQLSIVLSSSPYYYGIQQASAEESPTEESPTEESPTEESPTEFELEVPYELQHIYGKTNPCLDSLLTLSLSDIRTLDDRSFEIYKIQSQKCENYKLALHDFQLKIHLTKLQLEELQKQPEQIIIQEKKNDDNFIQGICCVLILLYLLQPAPTYTTY